MTYEESTTTDSTEKANFFNEFFYSSFNTKTFELPDMVHFRNDNLGNIHVTVDEVKEILEGINTNKATGPDNLSGTFLKAVLFLYLNL